MPQLWHLNTPFYLQTMVEQLQQTVSDFGGHITHSAATTKVIQFLGFTSLEAFYLANPALIPKGTPLANWQAILQQAEGHVTAVTINNSTLTPTIDCKALQLLRNSANDRTATKIGYTLPTDPFTQTDNHDPPAIQILAPRLFRTQQPI